MRWAKVAGQDIWPGALPTRTAALGTSEKAVDKQFLAKN